MILSLSHGQAAVERGFSVNKDVLQTNMASETIVAQRKVCDALASVEDVSKLTINKKMLNYCQSARVKYGQYLEEMKSTTEKLRTSKRKSELKLQVSKEKEQRKIYEEASKRALKEADDLADKALTEKKFALLSESKETRKRSRDMEDKIKECEEKIAKLEKDLKHV